ncbi:uncharacterized protein LOC126787519 [Argentina anserina]|uniref:uncharacterized protein LOC126787519 n=1 Tax=Argentina anserina TaxID=57926 RepID=UPI0021763C5A|nr:uncharacterized protein LOC126787519 [Potentilla anserina]
MMKTILVLLLCSFMTILFDTASAARPYDDVPYNICSVATDNSVGDSTFQANLVSLLNFLPLNASVSRFYNASIGDDPDRVYALYMCLDFLSNDTCHSCIVEAKTRIMDGCSMSKQAIVWLESCQLRYSNENFFGKLNVSNNILQVNRKNTSEPEKFRSVVRPKLSELTEEAAYNDTFPKMSATGEVLFGNETIYALVQCTTDLSEDDCYKCLQRATGQVLEVYFFSMGARLLSPSCYLRYEKYSFYAYDDKKQASKNQVSKGGKNIWLITILVSVSACLAFVLFGLCILLAMKRRKRKALFFSPSSDNSVTLGLPTLIRRSQFIGRNNICAQEYRNISFASILEATSNFSVSNKLGEGGYGPVDKGIMTDGKEVAIKRLSCCSEQGLEEFTTEVQLIMNLQHTNLVRLLGYCVEGEEKLLVYEYMPNRSLDVILSDSKKRAQLDWTRRKNIITGIARGILYLHKDSRLRIIHRDLKTSNVLLNNEMSPKISDFGMARIFAGSEGQANTAIIVGTYGYMAPEYAMEGLYSFKSDVFGFGVLLLEILTGKMIAGFHRTMRASLPSYAWKLWNEEKGLELIDPLLVGSCDSDEFLRFLHIGLLCVQEDAYDRPTMSSTVVMLKSETIHLSQPGKPAFSIGTFGDVHNKAGADSSSYNGQTISNIFATIYLPELNSRRDLIVYMFESFLNPLLKTDIDQVSVMIFIIILLLFSTTTIDADLLFKDCRETRNYTINSPFGNNLNLLLESLSSNTSTSGGFYNDTIGNGTDRVYGQALCRGDVNSTACRSCVHDASKDIVESCNNSEAIIWYELCQVRYSYITFFSKMDYAEKDPEKNKGEKNVSNPNLLGNVLKSFMSKLVKQTAYNSKLMFATGGVKLSRNQSVYGLQQCTRDISGSDCDTCLNSAVTELLTCCSTREGGTVVSANCNVRFQLYPFFNGGDKRKIWKVVVICVSAILSAVLIVLCVGYGRRRLKTVQDEERSRHGLLPGLLNPTGVTIIEENKMVGFEELPFIDLATIKNATDEFSDSNKLGQGGFGSVYKGWLEGKEVAVKRLSRKSWQGLEEFRNEVTLISKLQHRNLVRLLACGFEEGEKLLLYEFMPNKSLDTFIFDLERRAELNWQTYQNIIEGIARGLLYLHEESRHKIIHRDLKPSNVLLDYEMVPKISDFGMARMFCDNQNTANTKRVVGTHGYMAPEYAMEGLFSVKSDVFSFGVLLLEIISGKKNSGFYLTEHAKTLVEYAWTLWKDGKGSEIVEPLLMERCPKVEVLRYLQVALLCLQEDPEERPTMSAVVVLLGNDDSINGLPEPKKPAIFAIGRVSSVKMSTYNPCTCSNEPTISSISPR